jgi:hypothetical protein
LLLENAVRIFSRTHGFEKGNLGGMDSLLPATGTGKLLDLLDPHIPDDFINEHWHWRPARGQRPKFSAAQLWRVHLLVLLTPVHAFNLLLTSLPEQRRWRDFAHLPNQRALPDVRMLHEYRGRLGVGGLRHINDCLRQGLIEQAAGWEQTVALIDATDLPAACRGFKKKKRALTRPIGRHWEDAPSRLGRAAALSVTKSTPCDCGGEPTPTEYC